MGLIRNGDPYGFPDIDTKIIRGVKYNLDTVWRGDWEAATREMQLEKDGKTVYTESRYAPPEEVKSHLPHRGIPEIGEKPIHLDGRFTLVHDVWVAVGRTYRKKQVIKPKLKMIDINDKKYGKSWENWVGDDYATSRRKIYQKPKTKRQIKGKSSMGDTLNEGIVDLTKAAVLGTMGIGLVSAIGAAALRKKKIKRKLFVKRCGCK